MDMILHGNCTPVARLGTSSCSVGIHLGSRIGGVVGGEKSQMGIFQNRNQWKFFPRWPMRNNPHQTLKTCLENGALTQRP